MKATVRLLLTALIVLATNFIMAQGKLDTALVTRKFQLTFVTPLGTNGVESGNIANRLSINILSGYNGGLKGAEFGGFLNILKGDMDGVQLAGYANVDLKKGKGFQGAGFLNFNQKEFEGVQAAGYANVVLANAKAFQGSGFANFVKGNLTGVQLAGFTNVVTDTIDGFQGAGIANYSKSNTHGQISGFANLNFSDTKSFQVAGFSNLNIGNLQGTQLAGFANINARTVRGVQISGFFNYTRKLDGFQLGVINIVDTLEKGISIGVISYIKKGGYRTFEISGNESMYSVLSYKTGTRHFYNILAIGASVRNDKIYWGHGYGVGTFVPVKNRVDFNLEAMCFQVNENVWYANHLSLHHRFSALVAVQLSDKLSLFGGLSWNVLVSDTKDRHGNPVESTYAPWHIFDKTFYDDTNVKMYPGFSVGVRF